MPASNASLNLPYLVLSLVVVAVVVASVFVYVPLTQGIMNTRAEVGRLDSDIINIGKEISLVDKKMSEFNKLKTYEDQMDIVLPVNDAEAEALRVINTAASTSGVLIQTAGNSTEGLRQRQEAEVRRDIDTGFPDGVTVVSYRLDIQGTYGQIRGFISEIERAPRLAEINSVSLSQDTQNPEQMRAAVVVYLYSYITPKNAI